jgi:hypothetical protein
MLKEGNVGSVQVVARQGKNDTEPHTTPAWPRSPIGRISPLRVAAVEACPAIDGSQCQLCPVGGAAAGAGNEPPP